MVTLKKDMEDFLNEGLYGPRQTKPDERRKFLGTLRERIILALTKGQVIKKAGLKDLEKFMQEHPEAALLLNGNMDGNYFSAYRKLAGKQNIPFTIVTNQDADTDIGLIFAYKTKAIDKEDIYLKEERNDEKGNEKEKKNEGIGSFFKKWFSK